MQHVVFALVMVVCAGGLAASTPEAAVPDPLRLGPWLDAVALPDSLGAAAEPCSSSSCASIRGSSARQLHSPLADAAGSGSIARSAAGAVAGLRHRLRRRLQQLLHPGELAVTAALPTSSDITQWVTAQLQPDATGSPIPSDFLGISHEWTNVVELNQGGGSYLQLLKDLAAYGSGSLVVRVGGGSTDLQRDVPPPSTWQALRELHEATGFPFIFGLNFEAQNVTLTKQQMDAIQAHLPREAVLAYEVGNEPNFYANMGGKTGEQFVECCFVNQWGIFGIHLSCRNGSASCIDGQLAGPAWGHIRLAPATLDWFLRVNFRWMALVTVHWYTATREKGSTAASLLDEAPLRADMANLAQLVQTSRRWGKPLRLAEMNTISNCGQRGLSNSLAAALWTLDGALEAAAAGAAGINLHWGDGASLYAALLRQGGGASIVKPPYYAYLLFQMAVGGGAAFMGAPSLQATPNARVKVWALRDATSGGARVVLINKDASATAGAVLRFPAAPGYGDGKLIRLVGARGLADEWSVSLGNMTYTMGGRPFGVPAGEVVVRAWDGSGQGQASGFPASYTVVMPPGSAALLTLPKVA